MANLYDENGRQIMRGDILKVFHFTGHHRKRYYMYKQALDTVQLGNSEPHDYLKIGHLNLSNEYYHELEDGRVLAGYEIVQGHNPHFEDRPKVALPPTPKG